MTAKEILLRVGILMIVVPAFIILVGLLIQIFSQSILAGLGIIWVLVAISFLIYGSE